MSTKWRRAKTAEMATAYHEAGHAFATWSVKGTETVGTVNIEPDGEYLGYAVSKSLLKRRCSGREMTDRTRLRIEKEIMVLFAGFIAQRRFNARSCRSYHPRSDHQTAVTLAFRIADSTRVAEALIKWLRIRTDHMIELHWPMIEDLAAKLLQQNKIEGEELGQWLDHWSLDRSNKARLTLWQTEVDREEKERLKPLPEAMGEK